MPIWCSRCDGELRRIPGGFICEQCGTPWSPGLDAPVEQMTLQELATCTFHHSAEAAAEIHEA